VRLPAGGGGGRGGRAQHTALLVAERMAAMHWPAGVQVAVLCGASDGTDGPTSDAGGLVDPGTWLRAGVGVSGEAVRRFDAGTALAAAGDLVTTGPTGSNLCDLFLVGAARRGR
jgi:hydroxypyruvate reductase